MKRIALGQMNVEYGNFQNNVLKAEKFLDSAIKAHCDLILFPELWSTGFDLHNLEMYQFQNVALIEHLQGLSDKSNITICGTYIEKRNGNFYNSFISIQPNETAAIYHKIHLFKLMHEDKFFTPGIESTPFTSILGKTGMSICYDLRFPELFRDLSAKGVEIYFLSSHWPLARINHWRVLLQARAIENQAFMLAVNSVGQSGRDVYGGQSMVIAPDGEILLHAPSDEENLYVLEIDTDAVKRIREIFIITR